ncbi:MAG: hypothetical protein IAF38_22885 [Bacteroidia bacterium]|nr:hypothetical protein [Bacteroidia bacterium]
MKTIQLTLITIALTIIAACGSTKKTTSTVSATPVTTTTPNNSTSPTGPVLFAVPAKSADGIYAPGNEELTAIQSQYKEVTLDKLKEGYTLYTAGACIGCHGADNIYHHDAMQWKNIIDDMAIRANITEAQKDAVYKYVLSIKATQPK